MNEQLELARIFNATSSFNKFWNNLPKIELGADVMNLEEFTSSGTYWIALYVNGNSKRASYDAVYFGSFGAEHIPKEIKKFIGNKKIITNIYRIQA